MYITKVEGSVLAFIVKKLLHLTVMELYSTCMSLLLLHVLYMCPFNQSIV